MSSVALERHFQLVKKRVYDRGRQKHPGGCYGEWTWISGTFKVSCQGCGYTMRINPKTRKLEHLAMNEAIKHCLEIKEYGRQDYEG